MEDHEGEENKHAEYKDYYVWDASRRATGSGVHYIPSMQWKIHAGCVYSRDLNNVPVSDLFVSTIHFGKAQASIFLFSFTELS